MIKETYLISGMHCAACSASVERVTKKIDGVIDSSVNLTTEKLTISYDEKKVDPQLIIKYVESAGFGIKKLEKDAPVLVLENKKDKHAGLKLIFAGVFAFGLLFLCMGPMLFGLKINLEKGTIAIIEMLLALGVMCIGLNHFKSGFKSLVHLSPNMDTLVSVSCCVSFIYSLVQSIKIWNNSDKNADLYFESAGVVLFFIMLGKYMEANSKEKTKSAIKDLLDLAPKTALLLIDEKNTKEVPVSELKIGDIVVVSAGGSVPADCIITKGEGDFDESSFTGEPLPVHKTVGDKIIGGSILSDKNIIFAKVVAVGESSTLAEIVRFVEDAQGKKAPIASIADKVAGVFVPTVMGIALLSASIWAVAGKDFAFCLKIFTTVLVIACPCALGLATPTAIICGTGLGAKNGILIRSGEALETTHKANIVVLDKTGTLTYGKPEVCEVAGYGIDEKEVISLAAALEKYSDHPLAKAVLEYAKQENIEENLRLEEYVYVSGRGMIAETEDESFIYAGNLAMMQEHNFDCNIAEEFSKKSYSFGRSIIYIGKDDRILGAISLSDKLKEESKDLIDGLKNLNIKPVLLTGDNKAAAEYIANSLGIEEVYSQVLPKDKAAVVQSLKEKGNSVIMVGDGINDAPALSVADVGCAIGSGSDIAIDSADIVLMKSNPKDVARAIKLSRLTIRNIKQNLFWAFFYNCIGIPIAAGVLYSGLGILLTPMIGGLAMSFSSVFVVSNALRLRFTKL